MHNMPSLVAWNEQMTPLLPQDPNFIAHISLAYTRKKKASLIFCPSRKECEVMAEQIASKFPYQFAEYERVQADPSDEQLP